MREARAEGELRVHTVNAGDLRVADERGGAGTGDELAEALQGSSRDVHARGSEHDVVCVARGCVCNLRVEQAPLLIEALELAAIPREWTVAASRALPAGLQVDVQPDRDRALGEELPRRGRDDGAAAERDNQRLAAEECLCNRGLLDLPKGRLSMLCEVRRDRPDAELEARVDVDERPPRTPCSILRERRLPRAHEPDKGDVLLEDTARHSHAPVSEVTKS